MIIDTKRTTLIATTKILLSLYFISSIQLAYTNDWATGPTYQSNGEKYVFSPNLTVVPKDSLNSSTPIVSEKGSFAIINNTANNPVVQSENSPSSLNQESQNCGHCQILWNERTEQYALLRPQIIVGRKKESTKQSIDDRLSKITHIDYRVLSQFILINVTDMQQWLKVMASLEEIKEDFRFIKPEILEVLQQAQ